MFQALGGRYDSFGGTLSLAALAGAIGGLVLGRLIDNGRGRAALWINAAVLAAAWSCAASLSAMPPPWSRLPSAPRC